MSFLAGRDSALLADEMGLGKTVQAARALEVLLRTSCERSLVVAPASLVLNWERELSAWGPSLVVRRVQGTAVDRLATYRLPIAVLIASYEQVRADASLIHSDVTFDIVVLDEAQRIKNPDAATSLACRLLSRSRSWALTGTPVENALNDLVGIFGFVKPGLLRDYMPHPVIHDRMQPHFLRRRRKDVLPELPPLLLQDVPLEMAGQQRAAYDAIWEQRRELVRRGGVPASEANMLAVITKLKQACNRDDVSGESVKLDALRLVVDGLSDPGDKLLVFSQYVETLMWLSTQFEDLPHEVFHGEMSPTARDEATSRFNALPGPRALFVSLKAGGVGLNLQAASTVVLYDRWWNPAVEEQAIGRAYRMGLERPLHVVRFVVQDSIEERIDRILQDKRVLFQRYVEDALNAPVTVFSRTELRRLLDLTETDVESTAAGDTLAWEGAGGPDLDQRSQGDSAS
jgi:SNF2 family DNA or RNA helicase